MEIIKLSDIMAVVKCSAKFPTGNGFCGSAYTSRAAMTAKEDVIKVLRERFGEIQQRFGVGRLSLFGSVVRGQARNDSDIDVLVVFEGRATFDAFMDLKFYLEDLLGTRVDLVTDKALRPQVRREIERELLDVT
jgi:predicted nucleotidyltransferase